MSHFFLAMEASDCDLESQRGFTICEEMRPPSPPPPPNAKNTNSQFLLSSLSRRSSNNSNIEIMKVGKYGPKRLDQLIGWTVVFRDKSPIAELSTGGVSLLDNVGKCCSGSLPLLLPNNTINTNTTTGSAHGDSTIATSSSRHNHPAYRRFKTQHKVHRGRSTTPVYQKNMRESSIGARRPPLYSSGSSKQKRDSNSGATRSDFSNEQSRCTSAGDPTEIMMNNNRGSMDSQHVVFVQGNVVEILLDRNASNQPAAHGKSYEQSPLMDNFSKDSTSTSDVGGETSSSSAFFVDDRSADSYLHNNELCQRQSRDSSLSLVTTDSTNDTASKSIVVSEVSRDMRISLPVMMTNDGLPVCTQEALKEANSDGHIDTFVDVMTHTDANTFIPIDPPSDKTTDGDHDEAQWKEEILISPESVVVVATPLHTNTNSYNYSNYKCKNSASSNTQNPVQVNSMISATSSYTAAPSSNPALVPPTVPGFSMVKSRIPPSVNLSNMQTSRSNSLTIPRGLHVVDASTNKTIDHSNRKSNSSLVSVSRYRAESSRKIGGVDGGATSSRASSSSQNKGVTFQYPLHVEIVCSQPPLLNTVAVGDFVDIGGGGMHKNQAAYVVKVKDDLVQVELLMGMSHPFYVSSTMLRLRKDTHSSF